MKTKTEYLVKVFDKIDCLPIRKYFGTREKVKKYIIKYLKTNKDTTNSILVKYSRYINVAKRINLIKYNECIAYDKTYHINNINLKGWD